MGLPFILRTHFGIEQVIKILDDFLFVDPTLDMSQFSLRTFATVVPKIRDPHSLGENFTGLYHLTHLLMCPPGHTNYASLTNQNKLASYTQLITETLARNSVTVKELQSLIGKLQFATCAMAGGCLFLRRLHDLLTQLPRKYKPYWHIRISQSARKDLEMWHMFLINFNGITMI